MADALDRCADHHHEDCAEQGVPNSATIYLVLRDKHGEFKLCSICARRRREEWRQDQRWKAAKKAAEIEKAKRSKKRR